MKAKHKMIRYATGKLISDINIKVYFKINPEWYEGTNEQRCEVVT